MCPLQIQQRRIHLQHPRLIHLRKHRAEQRIPLVNQVKPPPDNLHPKIVGDLPLRLLPLHRRRMIDSGFNQLDVGELGEPVAQVAAPGSKNGNLMPLSCKFAHNFLDVDVGTMRTKDRHPGVDTNVSDTHWS